MHQHQFKQHPTFDLIGMPLYQGPSTGAYPPPRGKPAKLVSDNGRSTDKPDYRLSPVGKRR